MIFFLIQFNAIVGQQATGMAFNVMAQTEDEFLDLKRLLQSLQSHDAICRALNLWARSSMQFSSFSLSFDPDRSTAKVVRFTAAYGKTKFTANLIFSTHL
jgi:hypothetical protein